MTLIATRLLVIPQRSRSYCTNTCRSSVSLTQLTLRNPKSETRRTQQDSTRDWVTPSQDRRNQNLHRRSPKRTRRYCKYPSYCTNTDTTDPSQPRNLNRPLIRTDWETQTPNQSRSAQYSLSNLQDRIDGIRSRWSCTIREKGESRRSLQRGSNQVDWYVFSREWLALQVLSCPPIWPSEVRER